MEAALRNGPVPVEDYLEGEELAETKHEYVGGLIYAMAEASEDHNLIAGNVLAALRAHLKGGPCSVFSCPLSKSGSSTWKMTFSTIPM